MAIKLKNAVSNLYRRITGIPKSELRTQGQMIRDDYKNGPGLDYTAKSAILNATNYATNNFRPKGGKDVHAALDAAAPLINSTAAGKGAMTAVRLLTRNSTQPYSNFSESQPFAPIFKNSIDQKYGMEYGLDKSFPTDLEGEPLPGDFTDLIPVRIGAYQFRGAIGGMTDTSSPTWTGTGYAGRPDQIYSYSGVERTLSFDLKVYATTPDKLRAMYQRVNKLFDLTKPTPDYQESPSRMSAPITRLVIGNYINEQVIMTSLTITPEEEMSWEINDPDIYYPSKTLSSKYRTTPNIDPFIAQDRYVVPRALNINLGFTVLYDKPPTTAAKVFKSVTDGTTGGY